MGYKEEKERAEIALELYNEYNVLVQGYLDEGYKQNTIRSFPDFLRLRAEKMDLLMQGYIQL